MVEKIEFQWDWKSDVDKELIGFTGTADGRPIRCRITYEALWFCFNGLKDVHKAAVDNRETIETIASNMIRSGKLVDRPGGGELTIYLADCGSLYR